MKLDPTLEEEIDSATSNNPVTEGFSFGNKEIYKVVRPEAPHILVGIEYEYNIDDDATEELASKYNITYNTDDDDSEPELDEDAYIEAIDNLVNEHMDSWKSEQEDAYVEGIMDDLDVDSIQSALKEVHENMVAAEYMDANNPLYTIEYKLFDIEKAANALWTKLNQQEETGKKTLSVLTEEEKTDLMELLKIPHLVKDFVSFIKDNRLYKLLSNIDLDNYRTVHENLSSKMQSQISMDHNDLEEIFNNVSSVDDIDVDDFPLIAGTESDVPGTQDVIMFDEYFDDIQIILNNLRDTTTLNLIAVTYDQLYDLEGNLSKVFEKKGDWEDYVRTSVRDNFDVDDYVGGRELDREEERARQNAYDEIDQSDYYIETEGSGKSTTDTKIEVIRAALADPNNEWGIDYKEEIEQVTDDPSVPEGVETISKPLPLLKQIDLMERMFTHIAEVGGTASNTGMHVNMSIKGLSFRKDNFDPVKMVMLLDNNHLIGKSVDKKGNPILKYPARNNVNNMLSHITVSDVFLLAKSYVKGGYEQLIKDFGNEVKLDEKFQGINFSRTFNDNIEPLDTRRVEFRYMGGAGYHKRLEEMTFDIYRYAYAMMAAYAPAFAKEDYYKAIVKTLDKTIKETYPDKKFVDLVSAVKRGLNTELDMEYEASYNKNRKVYDKIINHLIKYSKEKGYRLEDYSPANVRDTLRDMSETETFNDPKIVDTVNDRNAWATITWKINPGYF